MSRIDHAAVAHDILAHTPTNGGVTYSDWMIEAQAHATLALVEQQRIANLIALSNSTSEVLEGQPAADAAGALLEFHPHEHEEYGGWHQPRPDIAAALGIEAKP